LESAPAGWASAFLEVSLLSLDIMLYS